MPETAELLERGRLLCDANRAEEAMRLFAAAQAQAPDEPEPQCWLAFGALQLGRAKDALEHAAAALRAAPDAEWALRLRTVALLELRRFSEAYGAAVAAVRAAPGEPAALSALASVALWRGRLEEAAILGRRLMRLEPESPGGAVVAGAAAEARHQHGPALALYEHALRLDPTEAAALQGVARLRGQGGRNAERAEILGLVVRASPAEPARRAQLASALSDLAAEGSRGARHRSIGGAIAVAFWVYVALGAVFFLALGGPSDGVLAYLVGLPVLVAALYPVLRRRFAGTLSQGLAPAFEHLVGGRIRDRAKLWAVAFVCLGLGVALHPALRSEPLAAPVVLLSIGLILAWGALAALATRTAWLWLRDGLVRLWSAKAAAPALALAGVTAGAALLLEPAGPFAILVILLWLLAAPVIGLSLLRRAPLLGALALAVAGASICLAIRAAADGPTSHVLASIALGVGAMALPFVAIDALRNAWQRRRMALLLGEEHACEAPGPLKPGPAPAEIPSVERR